MLNIFRSMTRVSWNIARKCVGLKPYDKLPPVEIHNDWDKFYADVDKHLFVDAWRYIKHCSIHQTQEQMEYLMGGLTKAIYQFDLNTTCKQQNYYCKAGEREANVEDIVVIAREDKNEK